jgi:NodT family efflux transporter outer membrane factor (OMF) lipoprotein
VRRAFLLGLLLAGCAPDVRPALAPKPASDLGLTGPIVPQVDREWWLAFGDPQLDRLVADALAGSPTLEAATARVRQAEAALRQRGAENGPNVTLDAESQGARLSGRYTIPPPYAGTVRYIGTAAANLNWNLDLFGRQKAVIESARASAAAARLDVEAARLMLAGAVVQSYLDLARAERQSAIARSSIATREGSLKLVNVRIRNQLASKLDATAAQTLLAQARQAAERATGQRALAANALAALAGHGADYAAAIQPSALQLGALSLPQVLPADLLARRADIAAAQARIAAAAAGRQAARRAYYPNINLIATVGLQAIGIGNFFNIDSAQAGGGGALHLPIFDNGRLRADLEGATAAQDAAIAEYDRLVVTAAREGSDAIASAQTLDAQQVSAAQVVQGFSETSRLNGVRVRSGLESRLDLVDTDIRLLDAQLTLANLQFDAALARVQLALALGGGFSAPQDMP